MTVIRPSREEFVTLARDHTVVPVWREVLADLETPVSAFVKLVARRGRRDGLPPRVGRARRALGTVLVHRPRPGAHDGRARQRRSSSTGTPPPGVPTDRGALAALEALLAAYRAPHLAELPPFHGGVVGYLGYDVVREIEHLPDVAARRPRHARRGAVGHRARHRVRPLPAAALPHRERVPRSRVRATTRCRRRVRRARARASTSRIDELSQPLPYVPVAPAGERARRSCRRSRRRWRRATTTPRSKPATRAHPRRRHLPGGARAALRPRRTLRPVRRLPRAPAGEPVALHVLRAPSRGHVGRLVARAAWCSCSTAA